MDFIDENRTSLKRRVCGTRSFRSHGTLSNRTASNFDNTTRLLTCENQQARFLTRANTGCSFVQINFITIFAQVKTFTKDIGRSVEEQIAIGRNNRIGATDSPLFAFKLGFKFPTLNIDRSGTVVVKFNPAVSFIKNIRLDFVQANRSCIENLIITRARVAIFNSASAPRARVRFVTGSTIHKGTAIAIGKTRPRRQVTESGTHVAFTLELDFDDIAFIHKLCHSIRLGILIPRAINFTASWQVRISLLEQRYIIGNNNVFALLQGTIRETERHSTVQAEVAELHVRNIRAFLDIDFDPFQCRATRRIVHDFGDAHIRNRRIDDTFGTRARKHRILIFRRRRRPSRNIRRRGRDITTAIRSNCRRTRRFRNRIDRASFVIGAGREQAKSGDTSAYSKPFFCIHERLPFLNVKRILEISRERSPVRALETTRIFVNSFPFCSGVPELGECTVL